MASLTFYFDRCFGTRLPDAIWRARPPFNVEFHHNPKNRFDHKTPDDQWLEMAGKLGWIVFSHDRKFHNESAASEAIRQHRIGCFYLWGANAETWDKLKVFLRAADGIMRLAESEMRPFIFQVAHNARISRVPLPELD
ncbi:MAG: hypothetical protein JO196_07640 [Hyphomicrobiales bacterium]|nr:hypothetical protein [Hyphomicrobiales bacterium]